MSAAPTDPLVAVAGRQWCVIPGRKVAHSFSATSPRARGICGQTAAYYQAALKPANLAKVHRCEQCLLVLVTDIFPAVETFFCGRMSDDSRATRRKKWAEWRKAYPDSVACGVSRG